MLAEADSVILCNAVKGIKTVELGDFKTTKI